MNDHAVEAFCSSSRMRESRPASAVLSSYTSRAIIDRSTRSCFRRCATSARSLSTISQAWTTEPIELDALLVARERMMRELQQGLSADERRFLLSLVAAEPEWPLLDVPHLEQLPGPRLKLQNLERLRKTNARKFAEQSDALVRLLR